MNKIHRIVWSAVRGAYIVAHEKVASFGKPSSLARSGSTTALLAGLLAAVSPAPTFAAPPVNTLPTNGQIVGGSAAGSIATSGNAMTVTQTQQRMIANWESFSIGSAASMHFQQPAGGVALNRVTGNQPSEIFGRLTSTGSVFLTNPNGVIFGTGAQVDVGSLVATTMKISDSNFMAGNYAFTEGNGSVINQGNLTAAQAGYIALLAPEVRNEGVITASLGQIVLGGAQAVTLASRKIRTVQCDFLSSTAASSASATSNSRRRSSLYISTGGVTAGRDSGPSDVVFAIVSRRAFSAQMARNSAPMRSSSAQRRQ
jgi:filamentous hemagglutinin family protein